MVTALETLTCKSSTRCPTCPHFAAGACALEAEIDLALAVVSRAPAPQSTPRFQLVDARKLVASA